MNIPSRAALTLSLFVWGCAPSAQIDHAEAPKVPPAAQTPPAPRTAEAAPSAEAPRPPQSPQAAQAPRSFDIKAIDDYVARQVKERGFVGLSLVILRGGSIVLAKGYGKSSLETGAAVEPDTAFAIGSITKQFTCAGALLLAEEGKLSVDDKVAKYYPDLTRAGDITLHDLMTHVSGYPDYYPLDFVDRRMEKPIDHDALIRQYAGGKLDFEPRTRWSYSNTGYVIAGRVIEKVSGEPFGKLLERRILKPLGMDHASFEPKARDKGTATGYTSFQLGDPEPARPEGDGWLYAAGGLYASASDLAKWDLGLVTGKVLKPKSYARMIAPRALADGTPKSYACGLGVSQRGGETVLQHSGAVSGFLSFNAVVPRTRSAVVLLSNSDAVDAGDLHGEILSLLLKDQADPAGPSPKVEGPPPDEVALDLLHRMQSGALDRSRLGEEFSHAMSDERVRAAAARLKALGEPTGTKVTELHERGGMEVATIRFTFKAASAKALLYRTPDGKIQQFLLYKQ